MTSHPDFQIKEKMIHFLRCAALFFHVYTDVPLPTGETGADVESLFVGLTNYLGLPNTIKEIVTVPGTSELIDRLDLRYFFDSMTFSKVFNRPT